MTAEEVIAALGLEAHPEGGFFRETFRDGTADERGAVTSIYYLLREGEISRWHRVDAIEIWHFHAGAPLVLDIADGRGGFRRHTLGAAVAAGETPQAVVPAHHWQSARPLGPWTLVGCTVAPAFMFEGFELAPEDWTPPGADS